MLTSRIREAHWEGIEDFVDPLELVSAPYYGVDPEELWRRASAKEQIAAARVPVLVLHPEDDQVIPVEHARMLDEAAKENELVRVWSFPGAATERSTLSTGCGSMRWSAVSSSAGRGTGGGTTPPATTRTRTGRGPS